MRLFHKIAVGSLLSLLFIGVAPQYMWAKPPLIPHHHQPYHLDSEKHDGLEAETVSVFQEVIEIAGVPWLRLHFSKYNLGQKSYITITSLEDGSYQRLSAKTLPQWRNSSAFFNGDTLLVELHAAPGERNIFFHLYKITVGEWLGEQVGIETLCDGDDDRVASTDSRVGRLFGGGCTAYLVSNGAVLTAGHCTDFDPDDNGPLLPDGVLDLSGVVEFNVPASGANGIRRWAAADDQYPIDTNNVTWHFEGTGQGFGKDWAVFAIGTNANNHDRAHVTRGFFRMTRESPSSGNTIRITGYGVDDDPPGNTGGRNAQNFTEQTDTGPYQGESSSGGDIWHRYRVDTRGANSGSPIIWNSQNVTIGIHTNGGCTDTGGENSGTSFEHNALENALAVFPGANVIYVDNGMPWPATVGTIFRPFDTVAKAVNAVVAGGTISIVRGTYNETITISKAMTLSAPVGPVTIGQ